MQKPVSKEGFHPQLPVNRSAVDLFNFSPQQVSERSILFFTEFREFRAAAYHINIKRSFDKAVNKEIHYAKPSDLNAAALINAIYKRFFEYFETQLEPGMRKEIADNISKSFPQQTYSELEKEIEDVFPYQLKLHAKSKQPDLLIRAILIRLNNENPALKNYQDLFSDRQLMKNSDYSRLLRTLDSAFSRFKSRFKSGGKSGLSLLALLREPFLRHPDSLYDQLAFIKEHWAEYLGEFLDQIMLALDFLKEENKPVFEGFGPPEAPDYGLLNDEYEAFSDDRCWMPNVVMLAKSTLVWLNQLSETYETPIATLDQIPDSELDRIHKRGFNALWLIGIWERSRASKRIKHIYGNFEAEASAYSLHDYEIATSLGGWAALERLRHRCRDRGIRLASDMVPNHTAIDSKWMIEHPDRFLQLPYNPMPQYSFTGEDLCDRDDISIHLEDQYYSKSDCAVVFKRRDNNTGEERYIYHGNDGTGLPWNDTAQINYLNPEAREAIIQTILHVASNFSIIRFDAAMTLAKKHIQRLWFPAPGQGGDIPTRSEHALTTAEFNKLLPKEFWREVVDRIATEAPDTLLLAEAFWMLEGYFVRTLGMHRVYNSAFMHMLRDEDNDKYRNLIKETLDFDPQILKRYVNFMNNPDEESAAEQFGKGDKYFGISMLLCTLPGLPMFGHGQVEGFYEKYGMEFKAAQWDEKPDQWLVERHEKEIFPLMRKRYLFSEVEDFRLYDFMDAHGNVNENVFAYSNRAGDENVLIVYNNSFNSTSGTTYQGVPYKQKSEGGHIAPSLKDFLHSNAPRPGNEHPLYVIFTESKSGLDYIRSYEQLEQVGLYCMLNGYEYQIFENFRAVSDVDGSLTVMANRLNGSGIEELLFEAAMLQYQEVHQALTALLNRDAVDQLNCIYEGACDKDFTTWLKGQIPEFLELANSAIHFHDFKKNRKKLASAIEKRFADCAGLISEASAVRNSTTAGIPAFIHRQQALSQDTLMIMLSWSTLQACRDVNPDWVKQLALTGMVKIAFKRTSADKELTRSCFEAIEILADCFEKENSLQSLLLVEKVRTFINVNEWDDHMWFDLEPFEKMLSWILLDEALQATSQEDRERKFTKIEQEYTRRHTALLKSDYKLSQFLANLKG